MPNITALTTSKQATAGKKISDATLKDWLAAVGLDQESVLSLGVPKGKGYDFYQGSLSTGFQGCKPEKDGDGVIVAWHPRGGSMPLDTLPVVSGGVFVRPNHIGHKKGTWQGSSVLFFEIDDRPENEQWATVESLKTLGLHPSAIVHSGGKSLHVYYSVQYITDPEVWTRLNRKLAIVANSDPSICNLTRFMRLPGGYRLKNDTWREQALVHSNPQARYTVEEFEAVLDSSEKFPFGLDQNRWYDWQRDGDTALSQPPQVFQKRIQTRSRSTSLSSASPELSQWLSSAVDRIPLDDVYGVLDSWHGIDRNCWCPFCTEKEPKPSFNVSKTGLFYCYGCESKGNVFSFIRDYHGLSKRETIARISELSGLPLPSRTAPDTAADTPPAPVKLDRESIIRLRILKPFGNRSYDLEFKSNADLEAYYAALPQGSLVLVDAPTGAGKTRAGIEASRVDHTIAVSPTRALGRGLANAYEMPFFNDCQGTPDRVAVVINSLQKIPTLGHRLFLGEIDQINHSLAAGSTNRHSRHAKTQDYGSKIKAAQLTIADSATATLEDLELLEAVSESRPTLVKYTPDHGHRKGGAVLFAGQKDKAGSNKAAQMNFLERLDTAINQGHRTILATDTKNQTIRFKHHLLGLGVSSESILVINSDTRDTDPRVDDFLSSANPGLWLSQNQGIQHIIYNSVMPSGVSIIDPDTENPLFQFYGGYFTGSTVSPAVCCQMLSRYRSGCDRVVFVARAGRYTPAVASWNRKAQARKYRDRVRESMTMNALDRDTEIRKSLGGIGFGTLTQDPFSEYAMATASRLCDEYQYFAVSLQAYLERDGFTAELVRCEPLEDSQIKSYRDEVNHEKADPIVKARPIDSTEHRMIRELPEPTHEQFCQSAAYEIRQFHGLPWDAPLNHDLVIAERFGAGRREHRQLMMWLIGGLAEESDRNRLESLGPNYYAHDLSHHAAALQNLDRFGVLDALDYCLNNVYSSRDAYLRQAYDRIQEHRAELERTKTLGIYLPCATGDGDDRYRGLCQFFGELLRRIGVVTRATRHREGESIIRLYHATEESVSAARERAQKHWKALERKGYSTRSTPLTKVFLPGVDQADTGENICKLAAKLEQLLALSDPPLAEISEVMATLDSLQSA